MSLTARLGVVNRLKTEQKELGDTINAALDASEDYRNAKSHQATARRELAVVKAQVLNEPANHSLTGKLKEVRTELATDRALLAQELAVYFSKEGKSELTLPDGTMLRFRLSATLTSQSE